MFGKRRAAALSDEIERKDVGRQAEPLADVARQAGAQVAGARADDDRVDVAGRQGPHRPARARRPRRDGGRVLREPRVEHVRIERERFAQIVEREMAAADAVVAAKHLSKDRLRSRAERRKDDRTRRARPSTAVCVQRVAGAAVPSPLRNIP